MPPLTNEQLQARCRVLAPITVVRDEDYTTMTPTQIADAWTAYSGGTDGVYLKDTDDTWYAMDADLPKANGRGLLVFGGGKQYGQDAFGSLVTADQAFPASWYVGWPTGLTQMPTAKGTANGLPYVEVTFSANGTTQRTWDAVSAHPGWVKIPHAEVNSGDVVIVRKMIDITAIPAQVTSVSGLWLQHAADPDNSVSTLFALSTGLQTVEHSLTDDGQAINYSDYEVQVNHGVGVTYASGFVFKLFPSFYSINTAFPDHFHCLNTSTSSAATIVPEVMQRPMVLDEPWTMAIVANTGKRDLGAHQVYWCSSTDANNYVRVYRATSTGQITLHVRTAGVDYTKTLGVVALETAFRLSIRATAQSFAASLNGGAVQTLTAPRPANLTAESLGHHYDGTLCGWSTIQNLVTRTGLATDAQLEEWSTAA